MAHRKRTAADFHALAARYREVRRVTEHLCEPLQVEDYGLQSMPDCSPPKWHLAHTTWFFETFILADHEPGFRPFHPQFRTLFNSYYETIGERWPRPARGLLSRPTVAEVYAYRHAVDERMMRVIEQSTDAIMPLVELGLNHEQQHQELLLTDLKHALGLNPLHPKYLPPLPATPSAVNPQRWEAHSAGVRSIGFAGDGFAFDNESPRHRVFVQSFEIASRTVTASEFLAFIDDGGYDQPTLWLSDGWSARQLHGWTAPLYWRRSLDGWSLFTLRGERSIDPAEPVCHVSYYEADAFARWAGARLPTEAEWEVGVTEGGLQQAFGEVWQWTGSAYLPYPGFRVAPGAVGEYNGKFMVNQHVLRGSSCMTPADHERVSYRNFFPPAARWACSGVRLARDLA